MSTTFAELREMTDDQLIAEHDSLAPTGGVGFGYYLDELSRRQTERQTDRMLQLAQSMASLTRYIFVLTVVNVILVAVTIAISVF
ncbi:MAG: hypothetical protein WBW04_19810 [Nitrolancea sp.]